MQDAKILKWQILYYASQLTSEMLDEKINEKQVKYGNMFTEDIIVKLIAEEMSIPLEYEMKEVKLKIGDIVEGLNDVELTAKVKKISEVRNFTREDNSTGQVVNVTLSDGTGELTLVLWNEKTNIAATLKPEQTVKITRGYTKKNNFGQLELGLGGRGALVQL